MNKQDYILIFILITIISSMFVVFKFNEESPAYGVVYYEDKEILKIDLSKKAKNYEVEGANGKVTIVAGDGKIKVKEEKSPLHLCSKQGFISKSYETIVCLPNKIVVKLESNSDLDTIAG